LTTSDELCLVIVCILNLVEVVGLRAIDVVLGSKHNSVHGIKVKVVFTAVLKFRIHLLVAIISMRVLLGGNIWSRLLYCDRC
jgi:hypothetical protein